MPIIARATVVLTFVIALVGCGGAEPDALDPTPDSGPNQTVLSSVPADPDPKAHYLIYLHGAIVETDGVNAVHPTYGRYEFPAIVKSFSDRGFTVIAEVRQAKSPPREMIAHLVEEILRLIDAGVPGPNITVVGFSKGGFVGLLASADLPRKDVNWVILAGCGPWIGKLTYVVPNGRVLSLVDESDEAAGSCSEIFSRMGKQAQFNEIIFDLGTGHAMFYQADPVWIEPTIDWTGFRRKSKRKH